MHFLDKKKRHIIFILLLMGALFITCIFAITQGSVKIPVRDAFIISKRFLLRQEILDSYKASHVFIVSNVRLPRIILSCLVGGLLSIIGVSFQAVFKNPMADPYVMGISSGAAFGATIGILFGIGISFAGLGIVSMMAFAGALISVFVVYSLAKVGSKISTTSILLAGFVMNSLLSSIISLLMLLNENDISKIVTWTMGSFNGTSWQQVKIMILPSIIGLIYILFISRDLNALVLGEEDAHNMGVNVDFVKKSVLIISSFLAASAVAVSGIIGFVGLIIPHLLRLVFGSDHKLLVPVSFFGGALFMVVCDTIARSLVPNMEIPVGIITSIFGGPFFLFLLQKNRKNLL